MDQEFNIFHINNIKNYFVVTYYIEHSKNLLTAALAIAKGQSTDNPNVQSNFTDYNLLVNHSARILEKERDLERKKSGYVQIAFPTRNLNWEEDGVSQLLCIIMGGQLDIDGFNVCRITNVDIPYGIFKGPKFGISGIRDYTKIYNKPLLGGIVKPKTGMTPQVLLEMTKQMCDGGINFIKEDEILSSPSCCPLSERVPLITNYLANNHPNVIYCFCINSDPPYLLDRVKMIHEHGGNGVHVNFWSGLGSYKAIRDLDLPIFMHFQKSGDKILTKLEHNFSISWRVMCQLAGLMGVDFIHAGMIGGYGNDKEEFILDCIDTLHAYDVMPALSCGMHPGLVNHVTSVVGNNYMANVGGAIHGHPGGTLSGVKAMRQAIDGELNGKEYLQAIDKWGLI